MADSGVTNWRLMADSQPAVLQGVSPECRGSVGLVSANTCWWDHKVREYPSQHATIQLRHGIMQ